MKRIVRRAAAVVAIALAAVSTGAQGIAFDQLVLFGDSLTDTGNNALALPPLLGVPPGSTTPVPVASNAFIPLLPYASGRYTNAGTWADLFAAKFGVSAAPSLLGGRNFAAGGATTGPIDPTFPVPSTYPPSLLTQVAAFLAVSGGAASPGALYVIAGGGNNARATFEKIALGGQPVSIIPGDAQAFADDVSVMVKSLGDAGATKIVVWNVPDVGATLTARSFGPAAAALATSIAAAMNAELLETLGESGLLDDVLLFDLFARVQAVMNNPAAFGVDETDAACAAVPACIASDAAGYFFWDGIHPSSVGHGILANAMIAFVPEPDSLALLAIAVLALGWVWARRKP